MSEPTNPPAPPPSLPPASKPESSEPKPAGNKTTMIPAPKCNACGFVNRVGALLCENCGTSLVAGEQSIVGTKRFQKGGEATESAPDGGTEKLSTDELKAVTSAGVTDFESNMILRLEVEGSNTPLLVFPKGEIALGRRDPATGTMPEVDLTAFAAYRLGVSRKHAVIKRTGKRLEIYDLGSSNGTAVNGVKLASHQPHVLRDGDMVTLGKMHMRVMFLVTKTLSEDSLPDN